MVPLPISAAACAVSGDSSTTLPAPQLPAATVVVVTLATSVTVPTAWERPWASWLIAVLILRRSASSGDRTSAVIGSHSRWNYRATDGGPARPSLGEGRPVRRSPQGEGGSSTALERDVG